MSIIPIPKVIAILGPTSSGKSSLAIEIARLCDGEIVSVDSRQVYREMDIGSGKVTVEEQKAVPHHVLDVADPRGDYNISHFLRDARSAIQSIVSRKKIPILCGGTGFWMQTLIENRSLPLVPPDLVLRKSLSKKTTEELSSFLESIDPERAQTIDRNNPHRLIRAIEIAKDQGRAQKPISGSLISENISLRYIRSPLLIALCPPKEFLDKKIGARLGARFANGMIEEVTRLQENGVSWEKLDSFGLEYRWVSRHLQGFIEEKEMREKLFFDIVHYAKRQMTWIRRWKETNSNLCIVETPEEAIEKTKKYLEKT